MSWHPLLVAKQASVATAIARQIADRLRTPAQVEAAVIAAREQSNVPRKPRWQAFGMAQGYSGLALLWGALDLCFPDDRFAAVAHECLEIAARSAARERNAAAGLHCGLGGVAFAAWYLSRGGKRYRKLLASVEAALLPRVHRLAAMVPSERAGLYPYDIISGLAGLSAYLVCRGDEPQPAAALRHVLASLVAITEAPNGVPRWHTPPEWLRLDERTATAYPHGNLNCGLAHGIPGPLAGLSLACRAGFRVDGIEEAIDRAAGFLACHRSDDEWGINWSSAVGLRAGSADSLEISDDPPAFGASHAAWCYGSPGVARALWLAGEALDRDDYRQLAVAAMDAVFARPASARKIASPTFCHGLAGLLQIALRFCQDTAADHAKRSTRAIAAQLLAQHEPDALLGYRSMELEGKRVDQPGLLDGAPGVALVLLAAATEVEPSWDRLFLLS